MTVLVNRDSRHCGSIFNLNCHKNRDFFHFNPLVVTFISVLMSKFATAEIMASDAIVIAPVENRYIFPVRTCPARTIKERGVNIAVHECFFDVTETVEKCGCENVYLNVVAHEGMRSELLLQSITLLFDDVMCIEVGWALLEGNIFHEPAILATDHGIVMTKDALPILGKIPTRYREMFLDIFVKRKINRVRQQEDLHDAERTLRFNSYSEARQLRARELLELSNAQVSYDVLSSVNVKHNESTEKTWKLLLGSESV